MAKNQIGSLDLNLILVFDALLQHQNVTRAAASLHVTQSAVSHSLARLRSFFDDPLFTRGAQGVTPTTQALELSGAVTQIAALVRDGLLTQAGFRPESARRTLTLCMGDIAEFALLPTLIAALREASPGCTLHPVQTQPEETRAMLQSGDADLAIGSVNILPTAQHELYGQKLYTQSNIVLAHAGALAGRPMDLAAYCELPHIALSPVRGRMSVIDDALARIGRRRRIVVTTEHHLVVPHLIRADSTLIATAPRTLIEVCRDDPAIQVFEVPVELPKFEVFQFWHARVHRDRFHLWFRGLISEIFQNNPVSRPRPS